jgi:hypothetical protein
LFDSLFDSLFDGQQTETFLDSYTSAAQDSAVNGSREAAKLSGQMAWDSGTGFPDRREADRREAKMRDDEWIKTLEDGRTVKFIYQELPGDGALITAQLAGNEVVYSVVLTKAKTPLRREDVESHFKAELSKK